MNPLPYKCLIIDDEPAAHYVLASYIEKNANLNLEAQCYNALDALDYIRNNRVDLIFLDIDMPEISGIEFLKSLSNPPKTILTTAHSQYAVESYDYDVADYLLKPISLPRFTRSIERFLSIYPTTVVEEPRKISLKIDGGNIEIDQNDIVYIQSYGNYVKVFTKLRVYLATTTTQEILSNLSAKKFMRIHKSYIVNLECIECHTESHVFIDKEKWPIGITYKRELLERLSKRR